jgi:hypothetical protein
LARLECVLNTHKHTHNRTGIHSRTYTHTRTHSHTSHILTHTHSHAHTFTHRSHIHTQTLSHTQAHTHAYTHTPHNARYDGRALTRCTWRSHAELDLDEGFIYHGASSRPAQTHACRRHRLQAPAAVARLDCKFPTLARPVRTKPNKPNKPELQLDSTATWLLQLALSQRASCSTRK